MQRLIRLVSLGIVLALLQVSCMSKRANSDTAAKGTSAKTTAAKATSENASAATAPNVARGQPNSDNPREVLAGVTKIAAELLTLKPGEIEVDTPLTRQKNAADELDIVEIVMGVEEAYNIEIRDEELGATLEDVTKNLTVRRLADIVVKKMSA